MSAGPVFFEYDIGDRVHVRHVKDIEGHVLAMSKNSNGLMYRVVWWQDGRRMDEWLCDWEISGVEP